MHTNIPHSWVLITLAIIANIMIFVAFSKKLEGLAASYTVNSSDVSLR